MKIDEIKKQIETTGEAWAIIDQQGDGPAWAVGPDEGDAWEVFRDCRDEIGIDPRCKEAGFRSVRITPVSALIVIDSDPVAWEAVENA